MPLTFDEPTHTYRDDGRVIPGVTSILKETGLINTDWFNELATWRGTCAHIGVAQMMLGTLDWNALDEELRGYVQSAGKFINDVGFNALAVEERRHDPVRGYAGTIDAVGTTFALKGLLVVDWKSGARNKVWHPLQTSPYARLIQSEWPNEIIHRATVHLKKDGGPPDFWLHEDDIEDWADFSAALRVFNRMRRIKG